MSKRIQSAQSTGWKLETTEGTAATLTQTEFNGLWDAAVIQDKIEKTTLNVDSRVGSARLVAGKRMGELPSLVLPVGSGAEADILKAIGSIVTGTTTLNYDFGGTVYSSLGAPNASRISTNTLTVTTYDGKEAHTLTGARVTSAKLGAKAGEVIKLSVGLNGAYSKAASAVAFYQNPPATLLTNTLLSSAVTLDGTAMEFAEIELDFGVKSSMPEAGNTSTGYAIPENTNLFPKITLTAWAGEAAAYDYYSKFASDAKIAFVWTFGSGTLNAYTITATCQIETHDISYANEMQQRKLTLVPVQDATNAYNLRISRT